MGKRSTAFAAIAVALALVIAGCSDDGGDDDASSDGASDSTTTSVEPTTVDRPDGPAADMSEALTGGNGVFVGSPDAVDPEGGGYAYEFDVPGYVEEELVASGTASSYVVDGELTPDGEWTLEEDQEADYRTRVLVRRPENPDDASGVVVVEWFNVSGGIDADPDWTSLREEIVRQGHTWVGVSAQVIGVEGGPVLVQVDVPGAEMAGQGLKTIDAERYASLQHPGDAFSYDIFTQVARAVREGQGLGDVEPSTVIAAGESQSAAAMVTYLNGVQPTTQAFDGFFVHSRGGSGLPVPTPGESADMASSLGRAPTIIRTDTAVPVMDLQAENDVTGVLSSVSARQPDSDTFRLWEVTGTAHADLHLVGEATAELVDCGVPINDGPLHVVAKAALRHLVTWVESGEPPPEAPRLDVTEGDSPTMVRDADGLAEGGLRTPPVEVPVKVLSGEPGPSTDVICILLGSTAPMPPERIAELYPSRDDYEARYEQAVDDAIAAGYVLEEDREAIEAYADPDLVTG